MADFTYKLKNGDTFIIGDSSNAINLAGTLSVAGNTAISKQVQTFEKVTTTGSSDVVDPAKYASLITSGGAHTVTLADGTYTGQIKKIVITAVAAGTITITPAHFSDGTSMTMAEILDSVELIWDGTNWNIAQASGVTIA